MFKVKTEYGYVLVEKDKIESIVPSTPAGKSEPAAAAKKDTAQHPPKPAGDSQPQAEPAVASSSDASATATNASAKTANPSLAGKADKATPKITNAIVAMGTSNESTLMVVGEEKTKEPLDAAAAAVEKRLHEVYDNYQRVSERKTMIGGLPAIEYQYRGKADDHDWSGKLVIIARGKDMFTVLAMTYADSDLIQIQENVISRTIASLDFSAH